MKINSIKNFIPTNVKKTLKKININLINLRNETRFVNHQSACTNIFHTCVPKTGSQWIKKIFSDPIVYSYSGLSFITSTDSDPRALDKRDYTEMFKKNSIISPLYISYNKFQGIPKPENYKSFFVMRDPRDIVVSWYFSTKISHGKMGSVDANRKILNEKNFKDGLLYMINYVNEFGLFAALDSWLTLGAKDNNVMILKYEDLISKSSFEHFSKLFNFLDIKMPSEDLMQILERYSFENLAGRNRGTENLNSHYRKGISGDWVNYLDSELEEKLNTYAENFLSKTGYK